MELYVEKGTQKLKNEFGRDLRFPKQFGDFAETLVMYILGLKSWSVALIDHVGADIIAINKDSLLRRFAISVKGRNFPSNESKSFDFEKNNINKLCSTAEMLGMEAGVAFVFVDEQEEVKKIRILLARLSDLQMMASNSEVTFVNYNSKGGIQIKFTQSNRTNHLTAIKENNRIFYSELTFNDINVFSESEISSRN